MNNMMGLIYTTANDSLGALTEVRGTAAVPVCARYRVIDFLLSSLASSGAMIRQGIPRCAAMLATTRQ